MLDIVVFQITVLSVQKREFKQNIAVQFCLCNLKLLKFKNKLLDCGHPVQWQFHLCIFLFKTIYRNSWSQWFTWCQGPKFRQHSQVKGGAIILAKQIENGDYWKVACTDGLCSKYVLMLFLQRGLYQTVEQHFSKVGYMWSATAS